MVVMGAGEWILLIVVFIAFMLAVLYLDREE